MSLLSAHRTHADTDSPVQTASTAAAGMLTPRHAPIPAAARSCCCPGAPVAQVIVISAGDRSGETEIFLCAHHLRASGPALRAMDAAVFDRDGDPIGDPSAVFLVISAR